MANKCTHFVETPQHFHTVASQARLKKLLEPLGDAYLVEMRNQTDEPPIRPAFDPVYIASMISRRVKFVADLRCFFIIIDPSCAKNGNYYVYTIMAYNIDGSAIVCDPSHLPISLYNNYTSLLVLLYYQSLV